MLSLNMLILLLPQVSAPILSNLSQLKVYSGIQVCHSFTIFDSIKVPIK